MQPAQIQLFGQMFHLPKLVPRTAEELLRETTEEGLVEALEKQLEAKASCGCTTLWPASSTACVLLLGHVHAPPPPPGRDLLCCCTGHCSYMVKLRACWAHAPG